MATVVRSVEVIIVDKVELEEMSFDEMERRPF